MTERPCSARSSVEGSVRLPAIQGAVPARPSTTPDGTTSFVIGTGDAGPWRTVVSIVCTIQSWQLENENSRDADVYIVLREEDALKRLAKLDSHQRMSRIPRMREICNKVPFAKMMRRMKAKDAKRFQFAPRTYCVPDEAVPSKAWHAPLIFKPDHGSCGDGISVLLRPWELQRKAKSLKDGRRAVVQEYIFRPLLIQSFKWDLRVYVLVLSLRPLRVFLCQEGLARVCCESYEEPNARSSQKIDCHLTNYSISKVITKYDHVDDPADGSRGTKRALSTTLEYLQSLGHEVDSWRDQVRHIVSATTEAIASEFHLCDEPVAMNCFAILGFDILISENGRAWLLEVNNCPSLCIDAVFPATGPYASEPADVPKDAPHAPMVNVAKEAMGSKALKVCNCPAHYRPHRHAPCAVDLTAKIACVGSALEIVRRDLRATSLTATRRLTCAELAAGTDMEVVHDGGLHSASP